MNKFEIGDHVTFLDGDQYLKGIVKNIYPDIKTAIVEVEDKEVVKVKFDFMNLDHDYYMSNESVQEQEPIGGSDLNKTVTISKEEFLRKQAKVVGKVAGEDFELVMLLTPIMAFLTFELFDKESE